MEKKTELKKVPIIAEVATKFKSFVESGALMLPKDYSPETALKIAGMVLAEVKDAKGIPALKCCTKESIANSLMKMVTLGLNPMRHCHFIMYGNKLSCDENYQAKVMIAKRDGGVKSVVAHAINEGDKFELKIEGHTGIMTIGKHEKTLEGLSGKVVGAYAIITMNDGSSQTTVMNVDQITTAWNQRRGNGLSNAHKNFPDEMAKKTVIGRALKSIIKSLDDRSLFEHDSENKDKPLEDIKQEVQDVDYVDFDESEEIKEPEKQVIEPEKEQPKAEIVQESTEKDPF